jgi:hypothetical protein
MSNGKYFTLTCQMLKCYGFDGFHSFVANSSPVRPWTLSGQGPSVVPPSSSITCTLVDSAFLFEFDDDSPQLLEDQIFVRNLTVIVVD